VRSIVDQGPKTVSRRNETAIGIVDARFGNNESVLSQFSACLGAKRSTICRDSVVETCGLL
jgi:hypothetical protein